jgi:hypothetical protein
MNNLPAGLINHSVLATDMCEPFTATPQSATDEGFV